ncbi:hypothetical protein F4677DRAFT_3952 [Hypoxylon crocopeplum]|nr:hypothetical protein F4677DRAFT_3952 [Hypoxylon crocopeplum]
MGFDCGFDIYPPLEPTPANQAQYELFLREVLTTYGLPYDNEPNPDGGDKGMSSDIVCVNTDSKYSYIEFTVGEHPRIPRRCQHFLRFSSKVSGSSEAEPYIRTVRGIAKRHLGDRVYCWHHMNELHGRVRQYGCYCWAEIRAARKRWDDEPEHTPEELRQGSAETDETAEASVTSQEKLYTVTPIPGKGSGFLATRDIPKGTRILLEAPAFKIPGSVGAAATAERIVLREVRNLSQDQQRAFLSLHNAKGPEGHSPFLGTAMTNVLPLGDDGDAGLFLEASRLNHSCRPNAQHVWNAALGCLTVHALRDVAAGCEITISYISGVSMGYGARQRHLMDEFSFQCDCELCSRPPPAHARSDSQLALMEFVSECIDADSEEIADPAETLGWIRRLIELSGQEGIESLQVSSAWSMAFQIAVMVGDKARAKAFGERAYAVRKLLSGDDNPTTVSFKRLAERPVEHSLYGTRMMCYDDNWEPPRNMGGEEFENWLWDTTRWVSSTVRLGVS